MSADISIEEILQWPEMADVLEELNDPRFASRRHGSRATYAKSCRGPLCRIAERLRARSRRAAHAASAGRAYIESAGLRKYDRDDLLLEIIAWHKRDMMLKRLEREEQAS